MTAIGAVLLAAAFLTAPPPARRRLRQVTGSSRPGRLLVLAGAASAAAMGLLASPSAAFAVAGMATVVAARRRRRARDRRRSREGRDLAAALEVVVGELRVGAHPVQAFSTAAAESDGPVSVSLSLVAGRARLGADVGAGLRAAARVSAVPVYWERIAVCWQLAAQHGLAMSALMQAAARDIRERQRFIDSVHAGTAGARATASILAGLPVVGIALGQLIGAHPLTFLLAGSHAWLLLAGVVLTGVGVTWSDRIVGRLAR